ncbi:MAG: RNA methyltransferase [Solirubrobacterales bacterium]|nr:RNA methyltransferase [Solirubrobacterales bacterium]
MITSKDNEKLKLARKLAQKKHRERLGLFVTEGEDLARAGLTAGHRPKAMLIHPDLSTGDLGEIGEPVEPALLDGIAGLASGTRVVGIWPEIRGGTDELDGICIYLDRIADPGNVGTIIRTVDALLDATVVAGPGTADHYSAGAVRASMGSIFTQPVVRTPIEATPEPRIATVPRGGERPGACPAPLTICLGAERAGLSEEILNMCSVRWTVSLRPDGAESLNVAAAAAIVCERLSSPSGASAGLPTADHTEHQLKAQTENGNG